MARNDSIFASRTSWNPSPNALTRLLEDRRAAGAPLLDLTEANPTRCGFDYPTAEILEALGSPGSLRYEPHPLGLSGAREAVASDYLRRGAEISPDHLVLTAGSSEAYSFLFRLLAEPGDAVLVPAPSYPLFDLLGRINDVRLVPYPLDATARFGIDLDALGRLTRESSPRALLLVSPGNPTGSFLKRREVEAIDSLCAGREIPLVCDEVFGDFAWAEDSERVRTLAGRAAGLTFVLDGLSKRCALPQLKLGWIAVSGPDRLRAEALRRLEVIADTFLSVNTPVQVAAPSLLPLGPVLRRQILDRIARNRAALEREISPRGSCRCLPAEGGWYTILQVPRTRTDEQWALMLLETEGILVHPGYFFDFPGDGHLVASLLPPEDRFRDGARRLLERIDSSL